MGSLSEQVEALTQAWNRIHSAPLLPTPDFQELVQQVWKQLVEQQTDPSRSEHPSVPVSKLAEALEMPLPEFLSQLSDIDPVATQLLLAVDPQALRLKFNGDSLQLSTSALLSPFGGRDFGQQLYQGWLRLARQQTGSESPWGQPVLLTALIEQVFTELEPELFLDRLETTQLPGLMVLPGQGDVDWLGSQSVAAITFTQAWQPDSDPSLLKPSPDPQHDTLVDLDLMARFSAPERSDSTQIMSEGVETAITQPIAKPKLGWDEFMQAIRGGSDPPPSNP